MVYCKLEYVTTFNVVLIRSRRSITEKKGKKKESTQIMKEGKKKSKFVVTEKLLGRAYTLWIGLNFFFFFSST